MPPTISVADPDADHEAGTIWWRLSGNSEVCVIQDIENSLVRVQYLNNGRFFRTFPLEDFARQWVHQPRISMEWLNGGSEWRRIHYHDSRLPEDRTRYTLGRVQNGQVTLFKGKPGNYKQVGVYSVWSFTHNYVRLWPKDNPFPNDPTLVVETAPKKREPRKPKQRRPQGRPQPLSIWDRIDGEDLV